MAARLLTPALLFALALAIRLLPWPTVLEPSRVVFVGMDAWYHMRRVQMTLVHGWPPAFDPYLNFPQGGMPIWPPFFDALVAAWSSVWAWAGAGPLWQDPVALERAAALLPPVLGAACVVVAYRLALRLFDRTIAAVAGLILCFLPAHFWYSQVGFVDHHGATALVVTLLLAAAVRLAERLAAEGEAGLAAPIGLGVLAGVSLLIWPGTLLHLGIVVLWFGLWWATREDAASAVAAGRVLGVTAVAGFVVVAPFGWTSAWEGAQAFSPTVLSRFQPWMFGLLAVVAFASTGAWSAGHLAATRAQRMLGAAGLGLALLAPSLLAIPDLATGFGEAWRWFAKDEVFQRLVKESKPLFEGEAGFDTGTAELRLSYWVYLTPLVWGWWIRRARNARARAALLGVAGWAGVLVVATLLQRRFFNSLSPVYAIGIAVALVDVLRAVPRLSLWSGRKPRTAALAGARVVIVAVALALFAPTLGAYRLPAANLAKRLRDEPMTVSKSEISRRALLDAAVWIGSNTPPTQSLLDPASRPEYGVLAPWGYGHLLKYVAQRPTVVGNFGDDVGEANLRRATAYFASRESGAVQILEDLRARYVLVNSLGAVPPEQLRGANMRRRLSRDDSPGLERHRLVYESPLDSRWAEIGRSEFRVFERVAGARLVGQAAPGAVVSASLEYTSNRGRRGRYETRTKAGPDGRYEMRVPYATRGGPPGVEPASAYRFESGGRAQGLVVPESSVSTGRSVHAPDFR